MENQIYMRLVEHLDRLPARFAAGDNQAALRLVQVLFTPDEAALAVHLTLEREEAAVIAQRAGLPVDVAEARLKEMDRKGLIFSVQSEDAPSLYQAAPFIVGILEFQINNRTPEYREAFAAYMASRTPDMRLASKGQVRTIPVGKAVKGDLNVMSYHRVLELIDAHDSYAVAPCTCRLGATAAGTACDAPLETCMMFGDWADYYVRGGRGRRITRDEVLEIIALADQHNLVLQPSNSQDIAFLCCCCGDCCGVLGELKSTPKPAEAAINDYRAQYDAALCIGCHTCLKRCQMGALSADGHLIALDGDRCIGCGLCVSTCPSGALTLQRKPEPARKAVPEDMTETWRKATGILDVSSD